MNKLDKTFNIIWKYKGILLLGSVLILLFAFVLRSLEILRGEINFLIFFIAIFLIYLVALIPVIYAWNRKNARLLQGLSHKGQWFSGTAGVILTSLTLLLISVTFYFQYEESKRNQYQMFENNFFDMVRSYKEAVESIEIPEDIIQRQGYKSFKGRNAFKMMYEEFVLEYEKLDSLQDTLKRIDSAYINFSVIFQSYTGHYFRIFMSPINLVNYHGRHKKSLDIYLMGVLRSQVSNYELLLLFYHFLSKKGNEVSETKETYRELIEKYHFLKYISDVEHLLIDEKHKVLYCASAFDDKIEFSKDCKKNYDSLLSK